MGLGLIALLVTAIGEYVEGLKQEALRKTQKLLEDSSFKLAAGQPNITNTYLLRPLCPLCPLSLCLTYRDPLIFPG